jgi:hypothetical protein
MKNTCILHTDPLSQWIKREGSLLPKKAYIFNKTYPPMVAIEGRGEDCTLNRLSDTFDDLLMPNLVHAHAIRATYLLESNIGFNQ